jgi:hypothetical protein
MEEGIVHKSTNENEKDLSLSQSDISSLVRGISAPLWYHNDLIHNVMEIVTNREDGTKSDLEQRDIAWPQGQERL